MENKTTKASLTNGGHGRNVTNWCNPYRGSPEQATTVLGGAKT